MPSNDPNANWASPPVWPETTGPKAALPQQDLSTASAFPASASAVAPDPSTQPFGPLGVVATVVSVVGWIALALGVLVILVSLVSSNTMIGFSGVTSGFAVVFSGLFLILGGGAVKVLIAIEDHLRPNARP